MGLFFPLGWKWWICEEPVQEKKKRGSEWRRRLRAEKALKWSVYSSTPSNIWCFSPEDVLTSCFLSLSTHKRPAFFFLTSFLFAALIGWSTDVTEVSYGFKRWNFLQAFYIHLELLPCCLCSFSHGLISGLDPLDAWAQAIWYDHTYDGSREGKTKTSVVNPCGQFILNSKTHTAYGRGLFINRKHLCSSLTVGSVWSWLFGWHFSLSGFRLQTTLILGLATTWQIKAANAF